MKKPLKIYLGDLTYDTVAISTNGIPVNIGYISSYSIARFGPDIDIVLFKYIDELEHAILTSPPDILGLSNYCWNQNLGHEIFNLLHQENPSAISVWGGPNIPKDRLSQESWLNKFPDLDIYVPIEGEVSFSNIVGLALEVKDRNQIRNHIQGKFIDGCIVKNLDRSYQFSAHVIRVKELDEIPSPYLTGILDKFFDGRLDPYIQTSRGCPFTCTFCADGSDIVSKVNRFSTIRLTKELNYIAQRVPDNVHMLGILDLNFGMFRGDLEICEAIIDIQNKYNYPHIISASTGKNAKGRIIDAIRKLRGSLKLTMAVQSMDKKVLKNINRENISEESMMDLAPSIKESGLQTKAEVILGLPGESYNSHLDTLKTLINAGMDEILVFTCMLLPGSALFPKQEREKWGLIVKHRILPRDFVKLSSGNIVIETEECVVGSDTMTFNEYVELRLFNFILCVTNTDIAYTPLKKFIKELDTGVFELVSRMLLKLNNAQDSIKTICNDYKCATIDELWDSPEEIFAHYRQDDEYEKLLNGRAGINVLYYHQSLVYANYMREWTDFIFVILKEILIEKKKFNDDISREFDDIESYTQGLSFNPLDKNRMSTNPKYKFRYDIEDWLNKNKSNLPLAHFKSSSKIEIEFLFTEHQVEVIQNELEKFDENLVGMSKALFSTTRIPSHYYWRKPFKRVLQKNTHPQR